MNPMCRLIFTALLIFCCFFQTGCHFFPGMGSKNGGPKKTIFGVHGKNDPNFGEKNSDTLD